MVCVLSWACGVIPGGEMLARLHACIRDGYEYGEGKKS